MNTRRNFIKNNALMGLGAIALPGLDKIFLKDLSGIGADPGGYIKRIENEIVLHGRDGNLAWFAPAVAALPPARNQEYPRVFVTILPRTATDLGPFYYLMTEDHGKTWSNPILCQSWNARLLEDQDLAARVNLWHETSPVYERPLFGLFYHQKTGKLLALGRTHFVADHPDLGSYKGETLLARSGPGGRPAYSLWNEDKDDFDPWKYISMPEDVSLTIMSHCQFHEEEDGSILIPGVYPDLYRPEDRGPDKGLVIVRCEFDGNNLRYIEHGSIMPVEEVRGWSKYSMIYFKGKYFLTIRHNDGASVTSGEDGLHYDQPVPWLWDDGEDLGNYNTGQKWLTYKDKLYLIYTRRSELNKGISRSRAPLFIAEVDPEELRVRKQSERILFPNRLATMGNFNMVHVSDDETWVFTGERPRENDWAGDMLMARIHWK